MSDLITEAKIMLAQYDGRNRLPVPGMAQSEHDLARALRKAANALEAAEARLQAARELHAKLVQPSGWAVCSHCEVGMLQDPADWPCATIAALTNGEPS